MKRFIPIVASLRVCGPGIADLDQHEISVMFRRRKRGQK
jgi:hypothetical protein